MRGLQHNEISEGSVYRTPIAYLHHHIDEFLVQGFAGWGVLFLMPPNSCNSRDKFMIAAGVGRDNILGYVGIMGVM